MNCKNGEKKLCIKITGFTGETMSLSFISIGEKIK